jgi:hypothetical protein
LADIGVVYLCRYAEGEPPGRNFVNTYRAHPAGVAHDFHVIFKGFPDQRKLAESRALFAGLPINPIELDDTGYDIGSYLAAAKIVSNSRLIFFNGFTELLADDWLKKFDNALSSPGVGLVGATGSWQSLSSYYEVLIRLGLHETRQFSDRLTERGSEETAGGQGDQTIKGNGEDRRAAALGRGLYLLLRPDRYFLRLYEYGRYPNPHVRSNAFMIERARFLSLHMPSFAKKSGAYRFESGRRSMTKQIMAQGLKPVVVGRDGTIYDIQEWKAASTYWVGQQANLIAADRRTNQYANGSRDRRTRLQDYAWVHPARWTLEVHRSRLADDLG